MDMFHGECDYAFATWLHRSRFTMGDITSFFNDRRLRPLHEHLSYRSAKKWRDSLSSIPFCLQDDEWKIEDIGNTSTIPGLLEGVHYLFCQNIVGLISFILSHRPFASKMAYAPIRTFNDDFDEPERMYHELHSADWWWETQAQLPPGATVIPVVVGILLSCADGNSRMCHPILCAVLADYEEQALITGVKSGGHCALHGLPRRPRRFRTIV